MKKICALVLVTLWMGWLVGCDDSDSSDSSSSDGTVSSTASSGTLASGSTTISGGGHLLATVTPGASGVLTWTVTYSSGGTGILGLSVDIKQSTTTLAHNATTSSSVSTTYSVTSGQSYDLYASTSDTDVTISYSAVLE